MTQQEIQRRIAAKAAKVVKSNGSWRIRRADGELVGHYNSKPLAELRLAEAFYLQ
jgi:hypothetical protein